MEHVNVVCVAVSEVVRNLSCSGLDWDSVYMEWEPPANPNGEILLYKIISADHTEEAFPLMLTHKLAYTFSGLRPDILYVISVAAVNSAGPGKEANCTAHTLPESGTRHCGRLQKFKRCVDRNPGKLVCIFCIQTRFAGWPIQIIEMNAFLQFLSCSSW